MKGRKSSSTPVRTTGLVVNKKSVGLKTKQTVNSQAETRQERSATRSAIPSARARSKSRTRVGIIATAQSQSPTKQSPRRRIDEERAEKPTKVRAPNLTTVTVSRQKQVPVEPALVKEYNLEEKLKQSKAEALARIKAENARNMIPEGTRKNVGFSDTNEIRSYNKDDGNSKVKEKMSLVETADRLVLKIGQFVGERAVKVIDGVREAGECTNDEVIFDSVDNLKELQLDVKTKLLGCRDGMFECNDKVNFNESDIQKLKLDCKPPSVIDRFNCVQGNDLPTDEYANDILSRFDGFKKPSINDDEGVNTDGNNTEVHKFDYVRSDITDDIAFRSMERTSFKGNATLSEV